MSRRVEINFHTIKRVRFASILKKNIIETFALLQNCCNYWPTFKSIARGAFTTPVRVYKTDYSLKQCWGSMTFWCGSGSVDSCLWLMDPDSDPDTDADPDPSIFIIDLQDANKKLMFFLKVFLHITFWRYFYIIFQEKKSKRSHKAVEIKVFHTIFA